MKSNTPLRRASRRVHVLLGIALGGCLMNPLLPPQTAIFMARVIVVLVIIFGLLIPGSWKRFVHRKKRHDTPTTPKPTDRVRVS